MRKQKCYHDYEFREQGETKQGRLFNIYRCIYCGKKKRRYQYKKIENFLAIISTGTKKEIEAIYKDKVN